MIGFCKIKIISVCIISFFELFLYQFIYYYINQKTGNNYTLYNFKIYLFFDQSNDKYNILNYLKNIYYSFSYILIINIHSLRVKFKKNNVLQIYTETIFKLDIHFALIFFFFFNYI